MKIKRSKLVPIARSWLGTRWGHLGRLKQNKEKNITGRVDCIGLIREVCVEAGHDEMPDVQSYDIYPSVDLFKEQVEMYAEKIDIKDVKPGDLMIFAFNGNFQAQHIAMITKINPTYIIHSYSQSPGRCVVEHLFNRNEWDLKGCYKLKNLEEDNA